MYSVGNIYKMQCKSVTFSLPIFFERLPYFDFHKYLGFYRWPVECSEVFPYAWNFADIKMTYCKSVLP